MIGRPLAAKMVRCLCMLAFVVAGPGAACADDFYAGRSIAFIIGSAPGGGYDTYSRLLAAHLGHHIGGRPTVIPQNMPGAGSIRATNYLYSIAPKDGTTIGMVDEAIYLNQILGLQEERAEGSRLDGIGRRLRALLGTPPQKTDARKFNWIGRLLANSAVLFARAGAPVRRIEDAFERELIVSASGTASRLNWTVLKNALGMKFKIVSGYQGSNESLLAMMRAESDALSMPWSILRISGSDLIRDGKINLLLQTGTEKDVDLAEVPRMIDLARSDEERALLELFSSPSVIGRSVVAPPGTPPERLAELRRAFMATMRDPAFLGDALRARLALSPLPGEDLQAAVARMGDLPDELIAAARRFSETAN
jgi:tripartite-type tricarboxylate transporter receptor subunit TctC